MVAADVPSMTKPEIEAMIARKREIDSLQEGEGSFVKRQRWMIDAIELLLHTELQRRHDEEKR